ncbi:MAG: protoheme IX farnesyltransferase [Acidobacteria bacterium]|nr:protoheme IX farnesyltransferase [Acidobacteriota bacterium]
MKPAADLASLPISGSSRPSVLSDYLALTKPRLNMLVVATSAAGYYLGIQGSPSVPELAITIAGTALVAGGASALNQVYERDTDALMRRTRHRPLPDGRMATGDASLFGMAMAGAGLVLLGAAANVLSATLALATLVTYLIVYTPMKQRSPAATLVGAVPGALPPLIGWTAATGELSTGGLVLFAIVFLWQVPHFMAIAWLCRNDYARAGFPMLPVIDPSGRRAARQAAVYSLLLVLPALAPSFIGISGPAYLVVSSILGAALIALAVGFAFRRNDRAARALFVGSILYLPLILVALIADKL